MGKLTFGGNPTTASKTAMVEKRYGATTGTSKGSKPLPKATVSMKGTNPIKGKLAITLKKKV
jgi:hypothetical protein